MESESVAMSVINSLDLYKKPPFSNIFVSEAIRWSPEPRPAIRADPRHSKASTNILPQTSTDLVRVSFTNQDPEVAAEAANAIVDRYMDRSVRVRFEGVTRISDWLSGQMDKLKQDAATAQDQLSAYAQKNNLIGTDPDSGGDDLALSNLATANQQLSEAEADRVVKEARYKMAMTGNPELLVSVAPSA